MENVDVVRSLPFSTDEFFAAIHECSNRRPEDTEFNRLTFCLLGVGTERFDPRHTRDAQSSLQGVIAIAFPPDGKTTPPAAGRKVKLWDMAIHQARAVRSRRSRAAEAKPGDAVNP